MAYLCWMAVKALDCEGLQDRGCALVLLVLQDTGSGTQSDLSGDRVNMTHTEIWTVSRALGL